MNKVLNILLVEDDELDQRQVERAFDRKGILYRMTVARNGEEALALLGSPENTEQGLPDIILLDVGMPKMNGLEFLQELRQNEKFSSLKVFILTNSDRERKAAEKLGVSGYIIKPLKLNSPSMDSMPLMIDILNM